MFLTALHAYAVGGFPDDRGAQRLATEKLQPAKPKIATRGRLNTKTASAYRHRLELIDTAV